MNDRRLEEAFAAEAKHDLKRAASLYEEVVAERPTLEVIMNLAILYWQASEYGMSQSLGLDLKFVRFAEERARELLALACKNYPTSTEPRFWSMYIDWSDYGRSIDIEECRALLREDPSTLVPALYLFSVAREAREEAQRLLEISRTSQTMRCKYIASLLESCFWLESPERL